MISWDDQNFHICERYNLHELSGSGTFDKSMEDRKEILTNKKDCFGELLLEEEDW